MDKKQNLDPALKATYERVMGTSIPSTPSPSPSPAPASAPAATPTQTQKYNAGTKVVAGSANGSKLSPLLIGIVMLLFFAIYTLIWLVVFKVNLPFIPKLF